MIREAIATAIKNSGKSQNQIAGLAKVRQSHLSKFLRGGKTIGVDSLERLLSVLGLNIAPAA